MIKFYYVKIRHAVLVITLALLCLNSEAFSQNKPIDVKFDQVSMTQLFEQLQKKTDLKFVFSHDDVANYVVSYTATDKTVSEILSDVFRDKPLKFHIVSDRIVVSKSTVSQQSAQRIKITGRVVNTKGEPIAGVSVSVKGTLIGTATNAKGDFELVFIKGQAQVLIFSFVGLQTQEIPLGAKREFNVTMQDEMKGIDDVVVTGYFDRSKNSFTGAATNVKREELRKFGNVNLIQALKMVDPSFKIKENNQMGSDPNTLPDFFVRGESSFMGSNVPIFIVDGYEVSLQYVFDMDLDRVESLNILKDASATVHYGSRAANGVVVIETRRPEMGKLMLSCSNRTSLSIADLTDYDLMDAQEKLNYEIAAGVHTSGSPSGQNACDLMLEKLKANIARGVNTDWLAQPTRNAISHSHSIYLEGGTDAVVYGVSANYSNNSGVIKKSSRENFGGSFDLTYRIKNKFSVRNSFGFSQVNVQNSPFGSFSLYAEANPYNPIWGEDGKLINQYPSHLGSNMSSSQYFNPLYSASLPYKDQSTISDIVNNLSVDWFIVEGLRFKGALTLKKGNSDADKYISPKNPVFNSVDSKGSYTQTNGHSFSYNINATLNYNLTAGKHSIYAGAGINSIENSNNFSAFTGTGYLDERFNEVGFASMYAKGGKPTGVNNRDRMVGFLGNLNYSYDNRYFADFSGRVDGSSKYGKNSRFAPLWSMGGGWNIHNEPFFRSNNLINRFTLRASIGMTGNQNFEPNIARTTMNYIMDKVYYGALGATFMSYGNTNLEWQRSLKRNVGVNLEFFNRRLAFRFDAYSDKTTGLLLPVTVTPSLGFDSYTENFGEQSNKGFEFDMNAVIIRTKSFDWAINFSGTHNKNRIEKISNALTSINDKNNSNAANFTKPIAMYKEGESLNAIKAVRSMGINPSNGNELFMDRFGNITETWDYRDKIVAGDAQAKLEGNIGTNIVWKQLSLNVQLRYSVGSQVYNSTLASRVEGVDPRKNADRRVWSERWRNPGELRFYKNIASTTVSNVTSRFVQDNDYIEMSNISLSYKFGNQLLERIGIANLRIALNSGNLFYFSTVKRERGIDYPYAQQYTFSLNLNF